MMRLCGGGEITLAKNFHFHIQFGCINGEPQQRNKPNFWGIFTLTCILSKTKNATNMNKIFLVLTSILLTFNTVSGQKKWSIRTNAGIASGKNIIDGYYFSFDFGIPLMKSLEISPTFSNASMLPNTFIYNAWDFSTGTSFGVETEGPRQEQEYGENLSSISLLLLFKPFELMNSEKLRQHELIIGTGISYNSYTMISSRYYVDENDYELTNFSVKSNRGFEPYYLKLNYNYLFRENLFFGFVAGLNGFDGEAELLGGLQFGIKFN
jgi:hypothetical protein